MRIKGICAKYTEEKNKKCMYNKGTTRGKEEHAHETYSIDNILKR